MQLHLSRATAALLLVPPLLLAGAGTATAGNGDRHGGGHGTSALPDLYTLHGDAGGSQFEGIALAPDRETFYVTEVSGGEVHRGDVDEAQTTAWLDEDDAAAADRTTAVGIATDRRGRVYIAGGSNRSGGADTPDLWVYDERARLLASLRVDLPAGAGAFLNDVVVAPDGAAYFTNSPTPLLFRVAREHGEWTATTIDLSVVPKPPNAQAFGLNGIEVAPDGRSLVVANSFDGTLWRYELRTGRTTQVDTPGGVDLTGTDGMVVSGRTLVAIRNFPHQLVYLRLSRDARSATLQRTVATDATRVFTTGVATGGRLLLVDSQFDETPPSQDSEVVALPFRR